jgi:uncharacterized protein (TIGR02757 family)
MTKKKPSLKDFLNRKVEEYNQPSFIENDPVSVPHLFSDPRDIEIAAFFAAIFAWGNRTTIIQKSKELMNLMDMAPWQFIRYHEETDLRRLLHFKHRTFNTTDLLYFIQFLQHHYTLHNSLETAFTKPLDASRSTDMLSLRDITDLDAGYSVEASLSHFHRYFFSLEDAPSRTHKHIATPEKHSTCKRLNMFLRWMVRHDDNGVDFGIWKNISPAQLICPIDLHVARVAKRFNLLPRKQVDWQAAVELTEYLRKLDPADPVKYDFALFGLGVMEKF